MRVRNIWAVYFSATGTTEKTVKTIACAAADGVLCVRFVPGGALLDWDTCCTYWPFA